MSSSESRTEAPRAAGNEKRILVLAPFGRDTGEIGRVLSAADFEVAGCDGVGPLCAAIEQGAAAALVAEEALSDDARRQIVATLAAQPSWSDLPLIILTSRSRHDRDGWHALRGFEKTAQVRLLERPLTVAALVSTVRAVVGSRERQYQIRDELTARRRVEEELTTLNETLEAQVAERTAVAERRAEDLRRLAAELTDAEHQERRRLAKLLHDDLQQLLLAVKLRLPVVVECDGDQLEPHVEKIDELLAECMSTSRNLTQELSPPVLEHGSLAEVLDWLGRWFGEKHGLAVSLHTGGDIPPAPEHVRVFLFDAVRELLFNVVKHSGTMEAHVGLAFHGGGFVVQVEDCGEGFDPEAVHARLQKPEGFGLFNIRERLEALGGRLDISNGSKGGACFRLSVPSEEAEYADSDRLARAPGAPRARHLRPEVIRILVVDDHQVVREGMVGLLDYQGDFEVVGQAADGVQAIEQVAALHPDAVIMDIDMPRMNGIDATREIKRRWEETVVVGLSLHEEDGVRRAMAAAGADGYISKHAPAKELAAAVRHLCG